MNNPYSYFFSQSWCQEKNNNAQEPDRRSMTMMPNQRLTATVSLLLMWANREIRKNLDSKYEKEKLDGLKRLIAVSLFDNVAVSSDSQQSVNFRNRTWTHSPFPCDSTYRLFN